jgi:hypothetical protein
MIKINKKLAGYLELVKPIRGVDKLKLSSYRHPCYDKGDHDLVKKRILTYHLLAS